MPGMNYLIRQLMLFTAIGTSLALNLGSTKRLRLKTLRHATLIEDIQTVADEIEATHVLRVDLGGELGAVRLHAPVSRLTRWPAGDIWPAGRALATRLSAEPDIVRDFRVLELGTGLGIAGIAAADAGARHVFLSDIDASAVRLALRSHEELGRSPGRVSGARIDFARGGWPAAVRACAEIKAPRHRRDVVPNRSAPAPTTRTSSSRLTSSTPSGKRRRSPASSRTTSPTGRMGKGM